ncbi:hypothetical protein [Wolbachia pipientis]|uniref:hypothetical protein n=1 Tax=Wolbachia pipientis TaxID=955 RepID=UPI0025A3B4F0|nr:hypothetical protein [Wolbachia pipientis]MDM8335048.1 hypothetical protein [Wolbachia pipientis]
MLSDRVTPTASVTKDDPRSKLASNRKLLVQGELKKINTLTAQNDFTVLKK